MKKVLGIFGLLVFVCLLTTILNPDFAKPYNIQNTLRWTSLFGIISIGVAFVIITGGIDLSIGSLVGLIGCILPMSLLELQKQPPGTALNWTFIATGISLLCAGVMWAVPKISGRDLRELTRPFALLVIGIALLANGLIMPVIEIPAWLSISLVVVWTIEVAIIIGLLHGFLITQVKLQPFVVTLCGLLFYRGFSRWLTDDQTQGFGTGFQELKTIATGRPFQMVWVIFAIGFAILCLGVWQLLQANSSAKTIRLGFIGAVIAVVTMGMFDIFNSALPHATLWSITIIGPLAIGFGIWVRSRNKSLVEPQVSPIAVAVVGYILAMAGIYGVMYPQPGLALSWQLEITPSLAQIIMLQVGQLLISTTFLILLVNALIGKRFVVLAPFLVVLLVIGLYLFTPPEFAEAIGFTAFATSDNGKILLTVFNLSLVVGCTIFFLRIAVQKAGVFIRSVAFLFVAGIILNLAGMIPIDQVQVPAPFLMLMALAVIAGVFLNFTIYGRYLLALGRNEEAARYSGINTDAMIVLAYVICSGLAAVAGILFALDINSIQPSGHGNFYELYAIAAAVLGGCSLRGGEGSILGVVIGAAVMRVLYNAINILGIPTQLEFAIIGAVILAGVIVDEMFKRIGEKRARIAALQTEKN